MNASKRVFFKKISLIFVSLMWLLNGSYLAAEPSKEKDEKSMTEIVSSIYKNYEWETVDERSSLAKRKTLAKESRAILKKYFTEELVGLLRKDALCVQKTNEICKLDFHPIFASQDPKAKNLKVSNPDNKNIVVVEFLYPGDLSLITVRFLLKKEGDRWLIDDICYDSNNCLKGILK